MSLFPGLPPLPSGFVSLFDDVSLLVGDLLDIFSGSALPQWGIFKDGFPVVLADNVVSFEYRADYSISTYPVEEGSFQSYNKVQQPFEARVRFSTGGTPADREAFLESIEAIIGDTELYDVVTPEKVYQSVNLKHQDYSRHFDKGAGLLSIEVWCEQIRATASAQFSTQQNAQAGGINQPQSVSAAPQANGGTVQSQTIMTILPGGSSAFNARFGPFS